VGWGLRVGGWGLGCGLEFDVGYLVFGVWGFYLTVEAYPHLRSFRVNPVPPFNPKPWPNYLQVG